MESSNSTNLKHAPFIIGVTGGTASGKTTVCNKIIESLGLTNVILLSMDRFYQILKEAQRNNLDKVNFDHPNAFDFDLLRKCLHQLCTEKGVNVPIYSFSTHRRLEETDYLTACDVIIVEGILSLYDSEIRSLMDLKIYVDAEDDVRLARRIQRDLADRGRSVTDIIQQYLTTVKPSHEEFTLPTKQYADIIIPRGGDNHVAIHLIVEHIKQQLRLRGIDIPIVPIQGLQNGSLS